MMRRGSGAALVAVALIAAGCGGGKDNNDAQPKASTSSLPAAPPADFVNAATKVCKRAQTDLAHLTQPTTVKQTIAVGEKALAIQRKGVADLKAIDAPSAQASDFAALVAALNSRVDVTQKALEALRKHDNDTAALQKQASDAQTKASKLAARLRLPDCVPA